jgi:hypothetical protein
VFLPAVHSQTVGHPLWKIKMKHKLIHQVTKVLSKSPVKPSPLALTGSFQMLMKAKQDYENMQAVENTKRQAIQAWREVQVKKLSDKREILESYLSEHFAERRYLIEEMFQRLDQGIASHNDVLIKASLDSIVEVARQSPLANVDKLMMDMDNPNVPYIDI